MLGFNGAGKSSLLRMLAGVDPVTDGEITWGHGAQFGYYAQEHEGLDPASTLMEHLRALADAPDDVLRGVLGHFLLGGDQANQPVRTLSGGEKTKLALLAGLGVSQHNVLLLDEPDQQPRRAGGRGGPQRAGHLQGRDRAGQPRHPVRASRSSRTGC